MSKLEASGKPLGGALRSTQIAQELLEEMRSGMFATASCLPAEVVLADQYGVSRTVIRDVLGELEREGFVERVRGLGTVVNRHTLTLHNRLDQKFEYQQMIGNANCTASADHLSVELVRADESLASSLALELGDPVLCIRKRVLADGRPVIYSVDYLPRALFGHSLPKDEVFLAPIFDVLEQKCKLHITTTATHVQASHGDAHMRSLLQLKEFEALLLLDETSYTKRGEPKMRSFSYYTNFFDFSLLRKKI